MVLFETSAAMLRNLSSPAFHVPALKLCICISRLHMVWGRRGEEFSKYQCCIVMWDWGYHGTIWGLFADRSMVLQVKRGDGWHPTSLKEKDVELVSLGCCGHSGRQPGVDDLSLSLTFQIKRKMKLKKCFPGDSASGSLHSNLLLPFSFAVCLSLPSALGLYLTLFFHPAFLACPPPSQDCTGNCFDLLSKPHNAFASCFLALWTGSFHQALILIIILDFLVYFSHV